MSDKTMLLPSQSRAARALLEWSRGDLAQRSGVSVAALADFESGKRRPYDRTLEDIRAALEGAGVIFVDENGEGPGVRLRKVRQDNSSPQTIPVEDLNAENDE